MLHQAPHSAPHTWTTKGPLTATFLAKFRDRFPSHRCWASVSLARSVKESGAVHAPQITIIPTRSFRKILHFTLDAFSPHSARRLGTTPLTGRRSVGQHSADGCVETKGTTRVQASGGLLEISPEFPRHGAGGESRRALRCERIHCNEFAYCC